MITGVSIKNLRGIRSGEIDDLAPLSILVGPNGSGKSTILDAILIGASKVPVDAIGRVVRRRREIALGARWLISNSDMITTAEISVEKEDDKQRRLKLSQDASFDESKHYIGCEVYESSDQPGHMTFCGSFSVLFVRFNKYEGPKDIAALGLSGLEIRLVDSSSIELMAPLHQLYSKVVQQGRRSQAREIIKSIVPGLIDIQILTEADRPIVHLVFDDHSIPVALTGDGIRSLLRLCLELASRPSGVVLLEEPEVHQHLGALRQSAKCIWAAVRRDIQVILTTHSLELIDCLISEANDDEELERLAIFRTQLDDGDLSNFRSSGVDAAFVRSAIHEDLR